ncbi:MAG: large-conductance mechanosensitive channel protein MscL [Muribaculaceae bacterium]|nr:large-conductance mechanosensitive channel protein MscL [Muribaculaceae bacterium]MDE5967596.1 large-conductance mechanosensitive channel protein MscL [Muribaculaceae bacterium]
MGKFLSDFKDFAMKGNVVDMAVGVIIGGAFGKIVTSMVNDLLTPLISLATGGQRLDHLYIMLREGSKTEINEATGAAVDAVTFNYGLFIQNIIDFLIIAFCIFMAIRFIQKFKKKEEEAPAEPPAPTKEEVLLTEIRDLLAKGQANQK